MVTKYLDLPCYMQVEHLFTMPDSYWTDNYNFDKHFFFQTEYFIKGQKLSNTLSSIERELNKSLTLSESKFG